MEAKTNNMDSKHQLMTMTGGGFMEINNLITITKEVPINSQYCYSCYGNSCSYRGEVNHLPWSTLQGPTTEVKPSKDTFHKGSSKWKLQGNGCFTFQRKSMHLEVTLVPSQGNDDQLKLILALKSCPQGASVQFDEIKEAHVTLHLMDRESKVVHTKCIRISVRQAKTWKDLLAIDGQFYSIQEFRNLKICQIKSPQEKDKSDTPINAPGSKKDQEKKPGLDYEYEFVQLQVELGILLQPREGASKCLTSTTCNGIQIQNIAIRLNQHLDQPKNINLKLKSVPRSSEDEADSNNNNTCNNKDVPNPEFTSKFTNMITLKVGSELQYSFPVHKHIITERSCVFQSMFESDMLESKTSEVKLPDVSPETMEAFLSVLYGTKEVGSILENVELMVGILQLGHQYQMDDLVQRVIQILVPLSDDEMTMRDALQMYSCGSKLHISDLQSRALQWFNENKERTSLHEREAALSEFIENEKSAAVSLFMHLQAGFCPENN